MAEDTTTRRQVQPGKLTRRTLLRATGGAAAAGAFASLDRGRVGATARGGSAGISQPARLQTAREQVKPVGSLTLAQSSDIHEIDPHRELWSDDYSFHATIYDSLIGRDDKMNLVPVLAESYANVGPTEWTFKLRQGVKFHNGEPLTIETIQWNVADAIAPGKKRDVTYETFDRVVKVDDQTFTFYTKVPDPILPQRLVDFAILPSKYFQEKGEAGFIAHPVGSGPYKFVEYTKASHIKVTANDDYWRGNAHFKDVTFRIIPDASTSIQALKAGEIDFMFTLPPDQFDVINKGANTKAASIVSDRVAYCQFFPESPQGKGELKDKRVRQAINYAINFDNILKFLLAGRSVRVSTVLPPNFFAYDKALQPYPYDPDKAKSLLAAAGFKNGFELTLEAPSSGALLADAVEIGQAMQADLGKVGIKVNFKPTELATMVSERAAKTIAPMWLWTWGDDILDPEITYRGILYKKSPYTFYGKPEWDKMIDDAVATLDQSKRQQLYQQLQRETYDDPPWLFMYAVENIYGLSKRVQFTPRTDERAVVWEMQPTGS